jgi:hypothetical protein
MVLVVDGMIDTDPTLPAGRRDRWDIHLTRPVDVQRRPA